MKSLLTPAAVAVAGCATSPGYALRLCAMLLILQTPAAAQSQKGFDADATKRAALNVEQARLEHEIGRFSSGRDTVFSGEMKVTQRDRDQIVVAEGKVLAVLSRSSPLTLTIVFPETQRWLQLTQTRSNPSVTDVTRLRARHANTGISATCTDCITSFASLKVGPLFVRLAAEGEVLDVARSRFVVQAAGYLERTPPKALRLNQVLSLRPDIASWLSRPNEPFQTRGRQAIRNVATVLRRRAPAPGGDTARYTCTFETRYTAQHFVNLNDLTRYGVRNLALGDTDLCCVDHALHDGSKICDREFP